MEESDHVFSIVVERGVAKFTILLAQGGIEHYELALSRRLAQERERAVILRARKEVSTNAVKKQTYGVILKYVADFWPSKLNSWLGKYGLTSFGTRNQRVQKLLNEMERLQAYELYLTEIVESICPVRLTGLAVKLGLPTGLRHPDIVCAILNQIDARISHAELEEERKI